MSRLRRGTPDPQMRVGHCCGCGTDGALYKIPNIFRYRCDDCFVKETGYHHWLSPHTPSLARRQAE